MTREGCLDIGLPPLEVIEPEAPKPVQREDLKTRALRKIQEDEAFAEKAREALEGFGTMVERRIVTGFRPAAQEELGAGGWFLTILPCDGQREPDWYVELAGDDVERPE